MIRLEPLSAQSAAMTCLPLAQLHAACFPEDPWDADAIRAIATMTGFFGRIASRDEDHAGFSLALALGDECEILALGVAPQHRRWGIGRALLDSLCREACRLGRRSVVLEVAADNIAARTLYASAGFRQVGCRRNYYRRGRQSVGAFVLRLTLAGVTVSA